ncbi:hypothetical protein RFI_40378, partial [Reticulomyxa filosa]
NWKIIRMNEKKENNRLKIAFMLFFFCFQTKRYQSNLVIEKSFFTFFQVTGKESVICHIHNFLYECFFVAFTFLIFCSFGKFFTFSSRYRIITEKHNKTFDKSYIKLSFVYRHSHEFRTAKENFEMLSLFKKKIKRKVQNTDANIPVTTTRPPLGPLTFPLEPSKLPILSIPPGMPLAPSILKFF